MVQSVSLNTAQAANLQGLPAIGNIDLKQQRGFKDVLAEAIEGVHSLQTNSKVLQQRFQLGDPNVSLEETMVAMNQASLSFQMLAQTRNKLTQAYSEIMSMPV